ncbi:MAG: chorismate-binding protein [Candidatus Dormibacteraeota bacterium]|nr:chorismate-binding protein [Candidatus Dormibacteraeota bacterium]MBV9526119.1 chorismate-binding protein [Candidatus Dormibacteraeota bacterium]
MAIAPRVPSHARVRDLLADADLVPVAVEIPRRDLTPVGAMLALGVDGECFLLESVEGTERLARWSMLGHGPRRTWQSDAAGPDPIRTLREQVASHTPAVVEGLDVPFAGGAVGFLSYEAARHFERIPASADRLRVPDAWFGVYDTVVVFDHARDAVLLIGTVHAADPRGADAAIDACLDELERLRARLVSAAQPPPPAAPADPAPVAALDARANMSREAFHEAVQRCHEYIVAGDIFQVQISRRFALPLRGHPFDLYRALREVNPSPYMFYLVTPHGAIVGASPEMLVRVTDGHVRYHPIAGTRRRGRDPDDDAGMEAELRSSEKEAAEHLMLVDLGRNDVGRVSATGSVRVTELMEVERYSHVMHLVSSIEAELAPGVDSLDALRACFPAGTVTGAPKIRAMEVIAELEPEARGVYAGAVGYVGWGGNLDTAIALRTLLVRDGVAYAQAAAGIVADSVAHEESLEIDNKVRALAQAVATVNAT